MGSEGKPGSVVVLIGLMVMSGASGKDKRTDGGLW